MHAIGKQLPLFLSVSFSHSRSVCWLTAVLLTTFCSSSQAQIKADQFIDFTQAARISTQFEFSWGSAWSDANGDGFPDLFVSNHFQERTKNPPIIYYSNSEGTFTKDTVPFYNRTADMHGAGWFDFDNDGDKDLTITTGRVTRNSFLVNLGSGNFVEQAVELGADFPFCRGRTPLFLDQNRDGLLDILVAAGPTLLPEQLPTSLALRIPDCDPTCFALVGGDSVGILPDQASTQAILIDPDGDDQLNPMIVTLSLQAWGATGCLPFKAKGFTAVPLTNEVLAGDFNGDMRQDLLYICNRIDQSYVANPYPVNYPGTFGQGLIAPSSVSVIFPPASGAASIFSRGKLRYIPQAGFTGRDSLVLRYCDSTANCKVGFLRFLVKDPITDTLPSTPIRDVFEVQKDSTFQLDILRYVHPYRYRMRGNLVAKAELVSYKFRTPSDSILVAFDEGALPKELIFIGANGYHPASGERFVLRASNPQNQGDFLLTPGANQQLLISFDTLSQLWQVGASAEMDFEVVLSLFSKAPIQILEYNNFSSVPDGFSCRMYWNQNGELIDATNTAGLNEQLEAFGAVIGDFDNDMDLDIYYSIGILGRNEPNLLLENDGYGHFTHAPLAGGAEGTNQGAAGTVTTADYNRDGFLDLFVANGRNLELKGPYLLYRNTGNSNSWLEIELEGTQSNRDGIGAVVRVYAGGKGQIRYADGGTHRYVQDDPILHFGLGQNKFADSITVRWPSGARSVLRKVLSNQILHITEPLTGSWACFPPVGLRSVMDPSSGVRLKWAPADCAQGYTVSFRERGSSTWLTLDAISDTLTLPFGSLEADKQYDWTVQAICESGAMGAMAAVQVFSTAIDCLVPANLVMQNTGLDSLTLTWDAVPGVVGYVLFYNMEGSVTYDSIFTLNNQVNFTSPDLDSTAFSWFVRSACLFDRFSEASETVFYTPGARQSVPQHAVRLQPNPAQTSVQLQGLLSRANYRITDLQGRELRRGSIEPGQSVFLHGLESGLYYFTWQYADERGRQGIWVSQALRIG